MNSYRLSELEPQWLLRRVEKVPPDQFIDGVMHPSGERTLYIPVEMKDADGIRFICPACKDKGHHSVLCWFEGKVPDDVKPGPGRWNPVGTSFEDLSFVPGAKTRSIQLIGGCNAHFFITDGLVHP